MCYSHKPRLIKIGRLSFDCRLYCGRIIIIIIPYSPQAAKGGQRATETRAQSPYAILSSQQRQRFWFWRITIHSPIIPFSFVPARRCSLFLCYLYILIVLGVSCYNEHLSKCCTPGKKKGVILHHSSPELNFHLSSIRKVLLVERFDVQFSSDSTRPVNDRMKIRES